MPLMTTEPEATADAPARTEEWTDGGEFRRPIRGLAGRDVLVLPRDGAVALSLELLLEDCGARAIVHTDPEVAAAALEFTTPALAILEIDRPGAREHALLDALATSRVPAILLTLGDEPALAARPRIRLLAKPTSDGALRSAIRASLRPR